MLDPTGSTDDQYDVMEIDEESSFESHEMIDLNSRKILDHLLSVRDITNNTVVIDRILIQAQIINRSLERSPYISVHNKDQSVKLERKPEYSVQAFDSVYARTLTTADGNCLYSSLSIIKIGSEKLTQSMRLLPVNAMINNSDHFKRICKELYHSFEQQINATAKNTKWGGGEVQLQAISIALCQPIYSYIKFDNNPEHERYIRSDISIQNLIDRFDKGTAGNHVKYIGYKSDMNKLGLCVHYTGYHYDALLPFNNNPQQFILNDDIIQMKL